MHAIWPICMHASEMAALTALQVICLALVWLSRPPTCKSLPSPLAVTSEGSSKTLTSQLPLADNLLLCIMLNCSELAGRCALDKACRETMICNAKCQSETNVNGCNFLCELNYGYNSTSYRHMLQCMADHQCLPKMKPDGQCLASESDAVKNLTSMGQIKGKWWTLKGLSCGQEGWPAGFDAFPCQRNELVLNRSQWVDHVAYCGGSNSTCATPIIYSSSNVSISAPGVVTVEYLNLPLLPQTEHWRVLSWPHPDWILNHYCGHTPVGPYAGGMVMSNSSRSISDIPAYVEDIFIKVAKKFNFDYKKMCVSDATKCSD